MGKGSIQLFLITRCRVLKLSAVYRCVRVVPRKLSRYSTLFLGLKSYKIINFFYSKFRFVEPPVLDMAAVVEDSSTRTPLIFVLSPGVVSSFIMLVYDLFAMLFERVVK